MANYKVSYKVLSQQGETLKAIAKEVDGYASRLDAIRGKLGDDDLLREVRVNLQKLSQQLGESRVVLNMAGDVVEKCVQGYTGVEKSTVKKVDSVRAHNRDFYKNPVVVASAGVTIGGGVAGAAAAMGGAAPAPSAAAAPVTASEAPAAASEINVNITTSETTTINYNAPGPAAENAAASLGSTAAARTTSAPAAAAPMPDTGGGAGLAMGAAAAGMAAGAGGLFGAQKLKQFLKDKKTAEEEKAAPKPAPRPAQAPAAKEEEDPEILLERALKEAAKYKRPEEPSKAPDHTPKLGEE